MLAALRQTPAKSAESFERYRFREAITEVMNLARVANKYFNDSEPWKTAKSDRQQCGTTINICLQVTRALAVLMQPIVPLSSERLWGMLNLAGAVGDQSWNSASELLVREGHTLGKAEILFTKIEDKTIAGELAALGSTTATQPAPVATAPTKPTITYDDFAKVDLRVARVVAAEKVPKSEKLLKLQVEVGSERRQIVAGIAQHYAPENLVGKSIVVVFNLQPAKLMGQQSEGMLLAASDSGGHLLVVSPSGDIQSGSIVK
jgi:methionyl-tRNA synthetase